MKNLCRLVVLVAALALAAPGEADDGAHPLVGAWLRVTRSAEALEVLVERVEGPQAIGLVGRVWPGGACEVYPLGPVHWLDPAGPSPANREAMRRAAAWSLGPDRYVLAAIHGADYEVARLTMRHPEGAFERVYLERITQPVCARRSPPGDPA